MRDKVKNLQKQIRELLVMFHEDTGMLPQVQVESKIIQLDGNQLVTRIDVQLK